MVQNQHLKHTKEQLEFRRIDNEYEFVKKRALINFLANAKLASEANFYNRTVQMLNQVQLFEEANLKTSMKNVADTAVDTVLARLDDPEHSTTIKRSAFEAALDGIRTGQMTYKGDALLPMIQTEMESKLAQYANLTKEEEQELLKLTDAQKQLIAQQDRAMKNEFLQTPPAISHGTVKSHDKYKLYMKNVHIATQ